MKKIFLVLIAVFCLLIYSVLPSYAESGNVFLKNSSAQKKVSLTFDDGPHPRYTSQILEVLEEYGIVATFFVIGVNVQNYPEAFEALLASDCEIGNHTFTHKDISKMSESEILSEIERTEAEVAKLCDKPLRLLRPPEGSCGIALRTAATKKGYDVILWSVDTLDWAHTPARDITKKVLSKVTDGDIILMHDYVSGGCQAPAALRVIIPELLSRGYEFVTVSELIGKG